MMHAAAGGGPASRSLDLTEGQPVVSRRAACKWREQLRNRSRYELGPRCVAFRRGQPTGSAVVYGSATLPTQMTLEQAALHVLLTAASTVFAREVTHERYRGP